ncbi:MAG TPA: GAF domain-containing protein, partial [Opitutus sp.]|nr:GAF domain-containing protein [Opitutus sp.]
MWFQPILLVPRERHALARLAAAAASVTAALYLRAVFEPWLEGDSPFAFLLPAIFVSAWFGGIRLGLAVTVLGGVLGVGHFDRPFVVDTAGEAVRLLLFVANALVITALCGGLHRAILRARRAAGEAARTFEIMANSAPGLIWSTDATGRCRFVNQSWLNFTGTTFSADGEAPRPGQLHPADAARYATLSGEAIATRRPFQIEYRLRRADGTYRWLREHAVPQLDARGEFQGYIGSCSDITDSRHEREELAFLARLQSSLAESLDLDRCAEIIAQSFVPRLADWCSVQLVDDAGRLESVCSHHLDHAQPAGGSSASPGRFTPSRPDEIAARVVKTGEPQLVQGTDDGVLRAVASDDGHYHRLRTLNSLSYLGVPLRARGRIMGVLSLATAESGRTLSDAEQRLVQKIAALAGLALENDLLYRIGRQALDAEEHALREMQ